MTNTEKSDELTERTEILFTPTDKTWGRIAAKADGRSFSGWVRQLVARELTSKYSQYHPGGDHEEEE